MYFHLVYSPECLAVASGRKSTRKRFHQGNELMFTMNHEFIEKLHIPSLYFPFMLILHGHIAFFKKAASRGVLGHIWVRTTHVFIVRKANFVYF